MYYFILAENLDENGYNILFSLFERLKKGEIKLEEIFDTYIPRIEDNFNDGTINKATFFEFFSFLNYCIDKKIEFNKVVPIFRFNVILSDDKLELINNNEKKLLTKKDFIISLRLFFNNQLFEILSNFTNLLIPDKKEKYGFDKMSFISLLLKKYDLKRLKDFFGDISLLFLTDKKEIPFISNELLKKYDKFVVKTMYSEMGKGVYTFDSKDISYSYKISKLLSEYKNKKQPLIVLPFYDIDIEYRVYYTYINNEIKIHTSKIKNNENITDAFKKGKLEMYKNMQVSFDYFKKEKFNKIEKNFMNDVIKGIGWNVGVLEFIKTKDNKLYFMEVNHLGGLLTCNKKDIKSIDNLYQNLYQSLLN